MLAGAMISLVGLTFDTQWHSEVGPDTFFTLPHLILYSGPAMAGLTSLFMVLANTFAARVGRSADPAVGGRSVAVLGGRFSAPLGYLVTGLGSASFLVYGLWDLWWHGLYGFDAVLESPPHIGLLLSISLSMIGSLMICAAGREHRWGRIGVVVSGALLLAFNAVPMLALAPLNGVVNAVSAGIAFLAVTVMVATATFTGRSGTAVATAAAHTVIHAALWLFAPWAARAYAASIGLPLRDGATGDPTLPGLMPMGIIVVALAMEGALLLARRASWTPRRTVAVVGALGGVLTTLLSPVQDAITMDAPFPGVAHLLASAVAGAVAGFLAGHLGWRVGTLLRRASGPLAVVK
ncbi:hypothetical protein DP939_18895 [Spongiactinospora rosea]|uniref:Uncharacterized protein n=1 Tax=Spongiactinospora rosea TaxID=2248750 RepID=A0A366LXP4_9ACTN|nr:hypothetical protein DP939_18895 [Spongiactinospora rosea]